MKIFSAVRKAFNWAAQPPKRNYTCRELFERYVQKKDWAEIDANPLGFSRAGRFVERCHTVAGGALGATIIIASIPTGGIPIAVGLGVGLISVATGKLTGTLSGKMTDNIVKGKDKGIIDSSVQDYKDNKKLVQKNRYDNALGQLKKMISPGNS